MPEASAPRVRLVEARLGARNAHSRMPFRYGVVTVHVAPVATLEATIESEQGARAAGYAADFLAYRWFDKDPRKSLTDNVRDLLRAIDTAVTVCRARRAPATAFDLWWDAYTEAHRSNADHGLNALTASFGASMPERAIIDAMGRLLGLSVAELVRRGALGLDLGRMDADLAGHEVSRSLPDAPLSKIQVRHTVGLLDPITAADILPGSAVDDGFPETLEDYLHRDGIRYLKVKVAGRLEEDLARLRAIADLLARNGGGYRITLDGNEQYSDLAAFDEFVGRLAAEPALGAFYRDVLFIEQPLERSVALDPSVGSLLRRIDQRKPVIIDEADGTLDSFKQALALGYRGVSHKNCKGFYKSLLNLARVRHYNQMVPAARSFLSAEDLTNLPVVPLQADLAAVALLGISHVERNGHHYFPGLDHLTAAEQRDALRLHPDLYETRGRRVALRIAQGEIAIGSLQVPGMGFAALPDMNAMVAPENWSCRQLGSDTAA